MLRSIRPKRARVRARVSEGGGERPPVRRDKAGAGERGVPFGDPPAAGRTGGSMAATSGTHSGTIAAAFGRSSRRLVLGPVAAQHLSDRFGSPGNVWDLCAGLEQRLDCGGIIPRLAVPAVLGAVDGPAERR